MQITDSTLFIIATNFTRRIEEDSYEKGCLLNRSHWQVMQDYVGIFDSMQQLTQYLANHFGLPIELSGWEVEDGSIRCQVLENEQGSTPTDYEVGMWKEGKKRMWLADYGVDIRLASPVNATDEQIELLLRATKNNY